MPTSPAPLVGGLGSPLIRDFNLMCKPTLFPNKFSEENSFQGSHEHILDNGLVCWNGYRTHAPGAINAPPINTNKTNTVPMKSIILSSYCRVVSKKKLNTCLLFSSNLKISSRVSLCFGKESLLVSLYLNWLLADTPRTTVVSTVHVFNFRENSQWEWSGTHANSFHGKFDRKKTFYDRLTWTSVHVPSVVNRNRCVVDLWRT